MVFVIVHDHDRTDTSLAVLWTLSATHFCLAELMANCSKLTTHGCGLGLETVSRRRLLTSRLGLVSVSFRSHLAHISRCLTHKLNFVSLIYRTSFYLSVKTRSQAVARIADRTASQHLWGSRDVIGHVTIW